MVRVAEMGSERPPKCPETPHHRFFISEIGLWRHPPNRRFLAKIRFLAKSQEPLLLHGCEGICAAAGGASNQVQTVFFPCLGSPTPPGPSLGTWRSASNSTILTILGKNLVFRYFDRPVGPRGGCDGHVLSPKCCSGPVEAHGDPPARVLVVKPGTGQKIDPSPIKS